ncbi:sigma 54-interacting transcriptional regulator [Anaeromicropila populeti]|uniref:PAS domain S-box-containing protein n=1 Tax=Anaeromicropila populeti TaxID=37658 RepID=A0A1I6J075_9FIRM|nr:sigma 54-interacting transcriptional regulator [Anaeromicropila populeti]SFR72386.1 PAS domain S-box-containing protein [Anaeromicropila populeti]
MEKNNSLLNIHEYMEVVLDKFHDGIYITDGDANTIYLNDSYEAISGLRKSEMMGRNMKELVAQGVVSRSGTLAVLDSGEEITVEQSFRTGKRAVITSTPIYDTHEKKKKISMVVTIVREITEIYAIRKELKRKEEQNRNYLNEIEKIRRELEGDVEMVAVNSATISLLRLAERAAALEIPILISGETGAGKEKLAQYIHKHSKRAEFPFVRLDFSVLQEENLQKELIGYVDVKTKESHMGILENAEGGILFIEELGHMPKEVQGLFLALLEDGNIRSEEGIFRRWNICIIAASLYSIEELRASKEVSPKLIDKFSLFPLTVPPLRERKEDIIPLANYFLGRYNRKTGEIKRFDKESYMEMLDYHWPGNVTELGNLVQQSAIISEGEAIGKDDIFIKGNVEYYNRRVREFPEKVNLKQSVAELEAEYMTYAYEKFHNTREAAEWLGMDNSTFVRKRQRYVKMGLMRTDKKI